MAAERPCWEEQLRLIADAQHRMERMLSIVLQRLPSSASDMQLEAGPLRPATISTQASTGSGSMFDGFPVHRQGPEQRTNRVTCQPGTWQQSLQSLLPDGLAAPLQRFSRGKTTPHGLSRVLSQLPGASTLSSKGKPGTEGVTPEDTEALVAPTLPIGWPTTLGLRPGAEAALPRKALDQLQSHSASKLCMFTSVVGAAAAAQRKEPRIIRPGSPPHVAWCFITLLTLLWDMTSIPVILAWDPDVDAIFLTMSGLSTLVWSLDMVLTFFTSVYSFGELQTSMAVIARHYLRTWFFFDICLVLNDWMSVAMHLTDLESGPSRKSSRALAFVKIGRLLRILRGVRLVRFIERQMLGSASVICKTVCVLIGTMILIHFISCSWFYVGRAAPTDTGERWTDMFDVEDDRLESPLWQQYILAFHWAAAQLTLGAIDVNCRNSAERCFNILCLLLGLIFGCSLVSSLSAVMVEVQMSHMDHHHKIERLLKYLRGNSVSTQTCVHVEYQMKEQLAKVKDSFEADEPLLQNLLPSSLYTQLRVECFRACITSHPLLSLWEDVHPVTIQRLCRDAMDFLHLQLEDELCVAGQAVSQAYYLVNGQLQYTQTPDSSAVAIELQVDASEGAWLCEAALWCDWVTVGTAVATKQSKLVVLRAEPLLVIMRAHHRVATLGAAYAESFHKLILRSHPPAYSFPTDLTTSLESFREVIFMMNTEAQVAIGLNAMNKFRNSLPLSGWAAHGLGRDPNGLDNLEKEITSNRSAVFLNQGGALERVVAVTSVDIKNPQGQSLVEVGKQEEGNTVHSTCRLPGTKIMQGEQEAVKTLLSTRLPMLAAKVEFLQVEQNISETVAENFGLNTTYIRTVYHARIADELDDMDLHRYSMSSLPANAVRGESTLRAIRSCELYRLKDKNQNAAYYCWLTPKSLERMQIAVNHESMSHWMSSVLKLRADEKDGEPPGGEGHDGAGEPSGGVLLI